MYIDQRYQTRMGHNSELTWNGLAGCFLLFQFLLLCEVRGRGRIKEEKVVGGFDRDVRVYNGPMALLFLLVGI